MFKDWTKKEKVICATILSVLFLVLIFFHVLNLILLYSRDTREIREEVKEAREDVLERKNEAGEYYSKGEDYKKQNEELKKEIERLSKSDSDCYMKFMKHSNFLGDFSDYNDDFYLSNVGFYESLVLYESKLDDYNKAIQRDMHRIILTPMLVTDFKRVGAELNIHVPITSTFSLAGGVGYFDKLYFKIGAGFRL